MNQIIEGCKQRPEIALLIALCYLLDNVLEFWMGRTTKFKSNSKLELLITIVAMGVTYFQRRKEDVSSKKGN